MRSGRPLRFLALTLGGWTTLRAVALWQTAAPPGAILPLPTIGKALAADTAAPPPSLGSARITRWVPPRRAARSSAAVAHATGAGTEPSPRLAAVLPAPERPPLRRLTAAAVLPQEGTIPPPLRPTAVAATRSRLAGSAWLIARGGAGEGGGGTLTGGQLGASQAGARLTYALGSGAHVALSARIATPFHGRGRDAAFGLDWQPTRAPLHLIAEQRVSLDGGSGGPTLIAVGGVDPTPVVGGFRLEAYGEAGAIARRSAQGGVEAFGDGAARLTRHFASLGSIRFDAGAGSWGAFQRSVRRLDIGPTLGIVAPVGRRAVRLTLDWRARAAGNARPGSGPALSLGTDF